MHMATCTAAGSMAHALLMPCGFGRPGSSLGMQAVQASSRYSSAVSSTCCPCCLDCICSLGTVFVCCRASHYPEIDIIDNIITWEDSGLPSVFVSMKLTPQGGGEPYTMALYTDSAWHDNGLPDLDAIKVHPYVGWYESFLSIVASK